ncbi:MAG: hypothetical protein DRN81_05020 [Thermoproteota archaeon]|nr:MAG: hypothetical protein DRN81_05020 [Candidatus Korarchaeota archaeon]
MVVNKCLIDLPQKKEFLINPIIDYYTILEKVNFKVTYNPFFRKRIVVRQRFGAYPAYFPEIGYLAVLETISPNLSREFYKETKEFERFYGDEKIIRSRIYHFNTEVNRFVSWGNYVSSKLPEEYYKLYISNLINDFLLMPSIVKRSGLIAPNRWFILESRTSYCFKTEVNYNVGIIYLTKDVLEKSKRIVLWLNSPLKVWEVPAGFVTFTGDGNVLYRDRILVHFLNEPTGEIESISNKGDYFICFLWSLNDYKTNFPKFKSSVRKRVNINLVESLTELVHSPYEIIPFIFPNIMESIQIDKLIFEFEIKKDALSSIIRRLMKFSPMQHPELLKSFGEIFENQNKLFKIKEGNDKTLKVTVVNPTVVPFLLRGYISGREFEKKGKLLDSLIKNPDCAIKTLEDVQDEPPTSWKWCQLGGIGNLIDLREKIFIQYMKIWKQNKIQWLGSRAQITSQFALRNT